MFKVSSFNFFPDFPTMWDLYEHAMSTQLNSAEVNNTLKKYATQGFALKQVQIIN